MAEDKKFTAEILSQYSGAEGKPAYVAYKDRVIDVSTSQLWKGGRHMMRHQAGMDLTGHMQDAPHGRDVLDRYPRAGSFAAAPTSSLEVAKIPPVLQKFLDRHPLFKRHPHPALVHFPIVFIFSVSLFTLMYLVTKNTNFELTAYYCLWCGLLFSIPAMLSGVFAWWVNYMLRPLKLIIIKIILSSVVFSIGLAACIWRTVDPHVAGHAGENANIVYVALVLLLAPLVLAIGYCGGMLTFPLHKE